MVLAGGTLLPSTGGEWGSRHLLQSPPEEDGVLYVDYKPPALDTIRLPRYVLYLLMAASLVLMVAYAIVGHLIKDLMHDFADWAFGPKLEEEEEEVMARGTMPKVEWLEENSVLAERKPESEGSGTLPGMDIPLGLLTAPRTSISFADSQKKGFF